MMCGAIGLTSSYYMAKLKEADIKTAHQISRQTERLNAFVNNLQDACMKQGMINDKLLRIENRLK